MTINVVQAAIIGLCACLSSMPGLGGTTFGNYTLGRPLIGGLVCGLVLASRAFCPLTVRKNAPRKYLYRSVVVAFCQVAGR